MLCVTNKVVFIVIAFVSFACAKYVSDINNFGHSKINSKVRQRRGLVDLSVDIKPVTNLLSLSNKGPAESVEGTSHESRRTTTQRSPVFNDQVQFVPKCGRKKVMHTELITNGLATKPGDWPWHAALYRLKTTGANQQYICGGSLVSETRVITAAHCVIENEDVIAPERLFVTLGKFNLAGGDVGSQQKSVFDIMVHSDFSRTTMANDIAIVKLSSKVKYTEYVQPICLWGLKHTDKSNIVNHLGTVVGWGFTEDYTLSQQLARADMPVVPDVNCIKSNPLFFSKFVTDKTFCAGFRNGTSACNGDSGGGMFFPRKAQDGQDMWYLRGIVSLSVSRQDRNSCDPNEYTVYTDAAQYNDFVSNNL